MTINSHSRALTLAEILVVVAILVVLIAILLPVIKRVRDLGYQTVCVSNMRQIAVAVRGYAIDNSGYMPAPFDDSGSYKHGWLYAHPKSVPAKQSDVETGIVYKYLAGSATDTTATRRFGTLPNSMTTRSVPSITGALVSSSV